ncbi:MAG: hypothetical protein Barrevirus3_31 [Barrevirus sp.]|uniref:Leucine-rich repeat protein n=1 Tax=Barrevirus sp. TaxID=2487763 RepID=A0A3G4ZSC4_9VIRU|nr:MAG: hypothetical protein Barrevirus3_31 [Barrevirus sp.]
MEQLISLKLHTLISECVKDKSESLSLIDLNLNELPDLKSLTWVHKLDLSKNNLTKIDINLLPPNLTYLCLNQNKIVELLADQIPETVTTLLCQCNRLINFSGDTFKNLINLDLKVNCLTSFTFPLTVKKVNISSNSLAKLGHFPETLIKFKCTNNMLSELPYINNGLTHINISKNHFRELPSFPDTIETVIAVENCISDIWYINKGLKVLNLRNNRLRSICCYTIDFPDSLRVLDLSDNTLDKIPDLNEGIIELYLRKNRFFEVPRIPRSVKILDMSDNCLEEVPRELKKRDIKFNYEMNTLLHDSDNSFDPDEDRDDDRDLYRSGTPSPSSFDDTILRDFFNPVTRMELIIREREREAKEKEKEEKEKEKVKPNANLKTTCYTFDKVRGTYIIVNQLEKERGPTYVEIYHKKRIVV